VENTGDAAAHSVKAVLSTNDPYITAISDNTENFGSISPGGKAKSEFDYDFTIRSSAPLGHAAAFSLAIESSEGSWEDTFELTVGSVELPGRAPLRQSVDFNNDGRPDLVLQDSNGNLNILQMAGLNSVGRQEPFPSNVGDPDWSVAGVGDFDFDGNPDLMFQHKDSSLAVWLMNGTTLRRAEYLDPARPDTPNWRVVAVGDFNSDGKVDLVFQNETDGSLSVWYMTDRKSVEGVLFPDSPGDVEWTVVGAGDFNRDGDSDLLFQHSDGTLAVWYLEGIKLIQSELVRPSHPGDRMWRVVAVSDLDSDSQPDLVFQHSGDGTFAAWIMNGADLNYASLLNPAQMGGDWKVVGP